MSLTEIAGTIHETAKEKGFWSEPVDHFPYFAYKLTMIHSEVTEVMEAVRKSKGQEQVEDEFADIIIRVLDLYEAMWQADIVGRTLDQAVEDKMAINAGRPKMHGVRG